MKRRAFITMLGGAPAAWPLSGGAQERVRRIGVLVGAHVPDEPERIANFTAFRQGLQQSGWSDGRNVRIDCRWGLGSAEISRRPRVFLRSKATCAAPLCEVLTPCRGRRPHHVQWDRIGTWEVSCLAIAVAWVLCTMARIGKVRSRSR